MGVLANGTEEQDPKLKPAKRSEGSWFGILGRRAPSEGEWEWEVLLNRGGEISSPDIPLELFDPGKTFTSPGLSTGSA